MFVITQIVCEILEAEGVRPYLGITQDGVVEQDAKEHEAERQNLLPCDLRDSEESLLGIRRGYRGGS